MLRKVFQYIKEYKLISDGDRVIAGVSGGPDSMVLLHLLHNLTPVLGFEVIAAHLNHGLRAEAKAEEKFVETKCREWDVPFFACAADVNNLAVQQKMSLEDAGRNARYQYFNELAAQQHANRIATAHHADDVAETVLLHLLRGTGIKGLRGIVPIHGNLIRPLLSVSKAELLAYAQANQIPYCLDQSNYDPAYLRNKVRHELLPYLQAQYNPRIIQNLNQLALIARDEDQVMEETCAQLLRGLLLHQSPNTIIINNAAFVLLTIAYQRRLTLAILSALAGAGGWELPDVQKIIELSTKPGSSLVLQLKKGIKVNKSYDKMIFTTELAKSVRFCYQITIPGSVYIKETGDVYSFELIDAENYTATADTIGLDYVALKEPLYLRSRQPGDVFRPWGLNGRKKIKDFFIDLKIPYGERDQVPLLASGNNEIYAVLGWRISQEAALSSTSDTILVIKSCKKQKI